MQKQKTQLSQMILLGLSARTNNRSEMNPETAKIGTVSGCYWGEQMMNEIKHRTKPGVTYAVYTDFESDEHGDYTYFIGEVVSSLEDQDLEKFTTITIPASDYTKFTTEPGQMPGVVISAWQNIWAMNEQDFGGKRKYIADFEVYDARASNFEQAIVDIYIGVEGV